MTPEAHATSRELETLVLRRLATCHQTAVVAATGLSEASVSRIVSGAQGITLAHLGGFLEVLGLQVIDAASESVLVPRAELDALRYFARKGIA